MAELGTSHQLKREDIEVLRALAPGTVVDLQITTPTAPKRVRVAYVGMEIPNCLIFQIPTSAKWMTTRDLLFVDNELVIRFVLEGNAGQVVAFRVGVLKLLSKPTGLLITSFPTRLESIGLRSSKRAHPGIAVSVTADLMPNIESATGIIVDISRKGCKMALPVKPDWPILKENTMLTMAFHADGEETAIKAAVKNYKSEADFVYYGLQFKSEDKALNDVLSRHTLIT